MKKSFLILFLFLYLKTDAQYSRHLIQLKYKGSSNYSLQSPSTFLSTRAIQRRIKYQITIDSTDLPVSTVYLDSIRKIPNVTILSTSKWLNQVLIQTTDSTALTKIRSYTFVQSTNSIATQKNQRNIPVDKFSSERITLPQRTGMQSIQFDSATYGSSYKQINIHEGDYLHQRGLLGDGIVIAMLDAGYNNYINVKGLDSLRNNNQILGTWDFVKNEPTVAEDNAHGLYCLSILAGNIPGKFIGTAPKASYYLFRTEDAATEFPVEELYWAAGAERADSLGADMINSSLGYTKFDDPRFDHSYATLNGNTTIVTRAADLAAKKGILVCNSAGNEGGNSWKYIVAPADGDSVLAIGATNANGIPAWFSSYGPNAAGKVKPDVASVGDDCFLITPTGAIVAGDGTSFSSPNLAGLIACLWQAFPEFNNMQIIDAVKRSASKYNNPDNRIGYGIPNMRIAYQYLLEKKYQKVLTDQWIKAFPNPFEGSVSVVIKSKSTGTLTYQLMDVSGRIIAKGSEKAIQDQYAQIYINDLSYLPKGVYFLHVAIGNNKETIRLLK